MGAQYSIGTTPSELEGILHFAKVESAYRRWVSCSLIIIIIIIYHSCSSLFALPHVTAARSFQKMARAANPVDPEDHFMSYATFRKTFPRLAPSVAHKAFRSYFQSDGGGGGGSATAAAVFGALALAAPATDASAKVRFLFQLHDRDRDRRLNRVELTIAVSSASRGLARMKRNPFPPPDHVVARVVQGSFGHPDASLHPDTGDIGWLGVAAFLGGDKPCLAYFRGLEAASFDAGGLYKRQEKLLLKLAHIDKRFVLGSSQCLIR